LSPAIFVMAATGPAMPVAVKVTGAAPLTDAVSVFVPAVLPSVHEPACAMPVASVVAVAPVTDPLPLATANVTVAPAFACPLLVTMTDGAVATACATVAFCWSPDLIASATVGGDVLDPPRTVHPADTMTASAAVPIRPQARTRMSDSRWWREWHDARTSRVETPAGSAFRPFGRECVRGCPESRTRLDSRTL
jgi:hypothetical protein